MREKCVTEQSGSVRASKGTSALGCHVIHRMGGPQDQGHGARRLKELLPTSVIWGDVWRDWILNWGR